MLAYALHPAAASRKPMQAAVGSGTLLLAFNIIWGRVWKSGLYQSQISHNTALKGVLGSGMP